MTATEPGRPDAPDAPGADRVVVLGWKPTEVLTALTAHGARVLCVCEPADADAAGAAAGVAEAVVVAGSVTDAAEVVAALARAEVRLPADAVVCSADEFPLVTASVAAEALGCRSWPVSRALALRDKYVQKQLVRAAGIPVAEAATVDGLDELARVPFGPPYVVKPFDGAGARQTAVVRTDADIAAASLREDAGSRGPWLVESFVEGAELHLDGVVRDGIVQLLSVSRYLNNIMDFRTGGLVGSAVLDAAAHPQLHAAAADITTRSLHALGHRDGVFHLELFEQAGGLVFGECAGRVGGGRVDTVVRLKFGVDLHDEWARAVLGTPSAVASAEQDERSFGWVHLPAVPGRITAMPTADEIRSRPGVELVELKLAVGDTVTDVLKDSNARSGRAVVSGRDAAEVAERLVDLTQWFRGRVVTGPAAAGRPEPAAGPGRRPDRAL
ncbi:hypothetical protein ACFXA3_07175 [Streptomyces sp. NPDC059456]|uniref:ATP-grasp domain-containing protein n=1 Tax=Streptomyces sp. NPDC059456 TaxID=3346838 RepID=UPI0036AD28B0